MAKEVREEVKTTGFASVSEYFRHLIREEKQRRLARELAAERRAFKGGRGKVLRSLRDLR